MPTAAVVTKLGTARTTFAARRYALARVSLYALVLALLLAGCGGSQSPAEEAADWESRTGTWWEAYEQGFRTGWAEGCEAASDRTRDEQPALSSTGLCGHPPTGADESVPIPEAPPDDPEGTGHSHGLRAGCEYGYTVAGREEESDICATGEIFG